MNTLEQFQALPREVRHAIVINDYRAIRHGEKRLVKTSRPPSSYGNPIPEKNPQIIRGKSRENPQFFTPVMLSPPTSYVSTAYQIRKSVKNGVLNAY